MSRTVRPTAVFFAAAWLAGAALPLYAADIAAAKRLYAAASYDEALAELNTLGPESEADEVQQYQALCLIALGRVTDAEQVLEALVTRNPAFSVAQRDLSPRFVALFESVRARTLPTVARSLYTDAKRAFDRGAYADASRQFATLLKVTDGARGASDDLLALRQLAEGFQKLADASIRQAEAARPAAPSAAPAPLPAAQATTAPPAAATPASQPPASVATTGRTVFTRDNAEVRPPVVLNRSIPSAPSALAGRRLSGVLAVVVNELGTVESAALVQPMSPLYDADLLVAARRWRFLPATRNGVPTPYRLMIPVVIGPPQE